MFPLNINSEIFKMHLLFIEVNQKCKDDCCSDFWERVKAKQVMMKVSLLEKCPLKK